MKIINLMTREQLLATYPKREGFPNRQEFEEAVGYWQENQGRNLAMLDQMKRKPENPQQKAAENPPDDEQMEMHRQHTECNTKKLQELADKANRQQSPTTKNQN